MSEERLAKIETLIAYQELTIKDLSDELYKQQQNIEMLVSTCEFLEKRLKEITAPASEINIPSNEKPPHY